MVQTTVFDTFCAGYRVAQRQTGSGRCGHGPSHPGIVVTGADDQRLHALGERRYWEGVADRVLLSV